MSIRTIRINELLYLMKAYDNNRGLIIFDVRDRNEYRKSHLRNSINLTDAVEIEKYLKNKKPKEIVVYCDRGVKSMRIVKEINDKGYRARSLIGGYNSYLLLKH